MTDLLPVLAAALAAGFLGSAHCLGMCAGISGLFAMRAGAASIRGQMPLAIVYNAGRVLSYALLGTVVAIVGQAFVDLVPQLAAPIRLISGLLIIVVGLQVAFRLRILAPIESAGAAVWKRVAPAAKGIFPVTNVPRALGLGLIWGLLPCGLVYSVLLIAASTATPASGAGVMIAFGIGTMPAMLATGLSAAGVSGFADRNRVAAGLLIVVLGVATIAMPLDALLSDSAHDHHAGHTM